MRRSILVAVAVLVASACHAEQRAVTDDGKTVILKEDGTWVEDNEKDLISAKDHFRKASWGMSKAQVKATEPEKPEHETDDELFYPDKILNMKVYAAFLFTHDKLVMGKYIVIDEHTNKNDFILDYERLKDALCEKYGDPKDQDRVWRDNLYKKDFSDWGLAVSIGHLKYTATWETEDTIVFLLLAGENYDIKLIVEYISKELREYNLKFRQEKEKKKL